MYTSIQYKLAQTSKLHNRSTTKSRNTSLLSKEVDIPTIVNKNSHAQNTGPNHNSNSRKYIDSQYDHSGQKLPWKRWALKLVSPHHKSYLCISYSP